MKRTGMDLTEGSILKKMLIYALPIMGINILQLLFTTADTAVLGRLVEPSRSTVCVAAVGSNTAIINLLVGLFTGISVGANAVLSKCVGARDSERAKRTVGSSIVLALISGLILLIIGVSLTRPLLILLKVEQGELLDLAAVYLRVYFLGMPIIMLYNFTAAILRAVGDTVRPLIFLLIGGVLNVIFNVIFVAVFKMEVAGVAIATVISNGVSAVCCLVTMFKSTGYCRFELKYLKPFEHESKEILRIGIPSGLTSVLFSISNLVVHAEVNAFGKEVTAGKSVATTFNNYVHNVLQAFSTSIISFVSQNFGAKNIERVKQSYKTACILIVGIGAVLSAILIALARPLCTIITLDEVVIEKAVMIMTICGPAYTLNAIMNTSAQALRGIGKSFVAMLISIFTGCVFRIVYVYVIEAIFPNNLMALYTSYPITWFVGAVVNIAFVIHYYKNLDKIILEDKTKIDK